CVEEAGTVEVDRGAPRARRARRRAELVERPDAAPRAAMRVLEHEHAAGVELVEFEDLLPRRPPPLRDAALPDAAREGRRASPLVDEAVGALLGHHLAAGPAEHTQRGLVRHRRRRQEERRLMPEQVGHPALELVRGGILALLLVADLGGRHGGKHPRCRLRHGVRAEVDHDRGRYRRPMDLRLLEEALSERGEPAFRARQVWEWTARGARGYAEMTNLPRTLREELDADVPFSTLGVEAEREARDGTVKTLFRTEDGHPVEAVLMRYRDGRRSLCLSSQSGCPLTCTFCATRAIAFGRNLTGSEIVDQALHFRRRTE